MSRALVPTLVLLAMVFVACGAAEVSGGPDTAVEQPSTSVVPTVAAVQDQTFETESHASTLGPAVVSDRDAAAANDSDALDSEVGVSERLPRPTLEELCSDDESEPPPSVGEVVTTGDVPTTGLVDLYSFTTTSLSEVADGRLPVVVWAWAPCMRDRDDWVEEAIAFARAHDNKFELVAVGMGGGFLRSLEMADAMEGYGIPVLWSPTGDAFIRRNFTIGSLQLFSVDFGNYSGFVRLNESGREIILNAIDWDSDGTWTGN